MTLSGIMHRAKQRSQHPFLNKREGGNFKTVQKDLTHLFIYFLRKVKQTMDLRIIKNTEADFREFRKLVGKRFEDNPKSGENK